MLAAVTLHTQKVLKKQMRASEKHKALLLYTQHSDNSGGRAKGKDFQIQLSSRTELCTDEVCLSNHNDQVWESTGISYNPFACTPPN